MSAESKRFRKFLRLKKRSSPNKPMGLLDRCSPEELDHRLVIRTEEIIDSKIKRLFWVLDKPRTDLPDFLSRYPEREIGGTSMHEIIFDWRPCKVYFDVDVSPEHLKEGETLEEVAQIGLEWVIESFMMICPDAQLDRDFIVFRSHLDKNAKKDSYHIIVPSCACLDPHLLGFLLVDMQAKNPCPTLFEREKQVIDQGVYGGNRSLRIQGTSKLGEARPKKMLPVFYYKGQWIKRTGFHMEDHPDPEVVEEVKRLSGLVGFYVHQERHLLEFPKVTIPEPKKYEEGLIGEISVVAALDALAEKFDGEIPYEPVIEGDKIRLNRIHPAKCPLCLTVHESDHAVIFMGRYMSFFCYRKEKGQGPRTLCLGRNPDWPEADANFYDDTKVAVDYAKIRERYQVEDPMSDIVVKPITPKVVEPINIDPPPHNFDFNEFYATISSSSYVQTEQQQIFDENWERHPRLIFAREYLKTNHHHSHFEVSWQKFNFNQLTGCIDLRCEEFECPVCQMTHTEGWAGNISFRQTGVFIRCWPAKRDGIAEQNVPLVDYPEHLLDPKEKLCLNGSLKNLDEDKTRDEFEKALATFPKMVDAGRIGGTRFFLTYPGHLNKVAYWEFIQQSKTRVSGLSGYISHETGDRMNAEPHTHVLAKLGPGPRLDLRTTNAFTFNGIKPLAVWSLPCKTDKCPEWDLAKIYMAIQDKSDPELVEALKSKEQVGIIEQMANETNPWAVAAKFNNPVQALKAMELHSLLQTLEVPRCEYTPVHPYERSVEKFLTDPSIDYRTFLYFRDNRGGIAKTGFKKYLRQKYGNEFAAMSCTGTAKDLQDRILNLKKEGWTGKMLIIDLPRSASRGKGLFSTLEQVKGGEIESTKYKGGTALFDYTKIVFFANFFPNPSYVSADRWRFLDLWTPDPQDPKKLFFLNKEEVERMTNEPRAIDRIFQEDFPGMEWITPERARALQKEEDEKYRESKRTARSRVVSSKQPRELTPDDIRDIMRLQSGDADPHHVKIGMSSDQQR